jgi:hypothetical protein
MSIVGEPTGGNRIEYHQLVADIQILSTAEFSRDILANKLMINSGSDCLDSAAQTAANYADGSFIPRSSWRHLEGKELECVVSSDHQWINGRSIGIIRIPDPELDLLRQSLVMTDLALADNFEPLHAISREDIYQQAIDRLLKYLKPYNINDLNPIKCLGINDSLPELITTTRDLINYLPETPYVGLHLDSWEKDPLKRRHLSKNRLCINLGQEQRYFLFINLSLLQIFQMLGLKDPQDIPQYYRATNLTDLFLQTYPNYPVCKLALAPNEAYIAPTENMIHDATSIDKQQIDLSLTFLGKFWIPTV